MLLIVIFYLVDRSYCACATGTAFKDDFHFNNSEIWAPIFSSGVEQVPKYAMIPTHCHYNISMDSWFGLAMALDDVPCSTNPNACGGCAYASCHLRTGACYSYGTYEVLMRASFPSTVPTLACFSTYTDDPQHNEIDICFNDNDSILHAAYFNGENGDKEILQPVNLGFSSSSGYNHFSFVWSPNSIVWSVNGKVVHTATQSNGKIPWLPQQIVLILRPLSATYKGTAFQNVVYVSYTPA